ncbi:MAG: histidine kinase dimerization/phosphoacceptor domain -containing protein [Prolixibacteraceae bacterium]
MRYILLIIFILTVSTKSSAQQAAALIDSLENELVNIRLSDTWDKNTEALVLLKLSYYSFDDPVKASNYATQALEASRAAGNKMREELAIIYLGEAEKKFGNNLKAIDYYIQAANLQHELEEFHDEAITLGGIASLFGRLGDRTNATQYYKKAIEQLLTYHDTLSLAAIQIDMGEYYRKHSELDSAIFYFEKSKQNLNSIKSRENIISLNTNKSTCQGNLGMTYLENGNIEKAKPLLEHANEFFTENFSPYRKSVYQCELGKLYILEGKVQKGEALINESLQMAQEAQLKEQIKDFSKELSAFYEQQNQPQKALRFYQQYKLYDDSLKNVENVRKLEQQQSQFQLSRKDEEIEILNKINKLQRILGMGLFAGVLVVIVFIFIVIRANLRIKVINKEITLQKQLVEEREKEKALLLRELNHRVKNNLQMVASLLSLHSRQLKGHPAAEALMEGKYRVEALTLIHQKLYRDDVDTKIDLKDYIEELSQNLVMNFNKDFKLELYLVPFIMKIDKAIPLGLILNELLTNSLKYGKAEGKQPVLKISIQKLPEHVLLIIEDNGTGLPVDFDFKRTDSFGLKLVHSLINQLGGKIDWSSEGGTRWIVTLNTLKIS